MRLEKELTSGDVTQRYVAEIEIDKLDEKDQETIKRWQDLTDRVCKVKHGEAV